MGAIKDSPEMNLEPKNALEFQKSDLRGFNISKGLRN